MRDVENEEFGNNGGEQLKFEACVLGNKRFQRGERFDVFRMQGDNGIKHVE